MPHHIPQRKAKVLKTVHKASHDRVYVASVIHSSLTHSAPLCLPFFAPLQPQSPCFSLNVPDIPLALSPPKHPLDSALHPLLVFAQVSCSQWRKNTLLTIIHSHLLPYLKVLIPQPFSFSVFHNLYHLLEYRVLLFIGPIFVVCHPTRMATSRELTFICYKVRPEWLG